MRPAKSERKRQAALTDAQCYFLVDEVTVHEEVIRSKVNTADMHKKKNGAWVQIAANFGARYPETPRDVSFFRKKWENMVSVAKNYKVTKRLWDEKRTTGGGPAPSPPPGYILAVADMYEDSEAFKGVGQPLESESADKTANDDTDEATVTVSASSTSAGTASTSAATSLTRSTLFSGPSSPVVGGQQRKAATKKPSSTPATLPVTPQPKKSKTDRIAALHEDVLVLEKQKLILEKRKLRLECKKLEKEIMLLEGKQCPHASPAFVAEMQVLQPATIAITTTTTTTTPAAAAAAAADTSATPGADVFSPLGTSLPGFTSEEPRLFTL